MPHPDQGKEAVLWDFVVPVAIGTGVALVIAFGVIVVRACRRRRLVKVRFGGKVGMKILIKYLTETAKKCLLLT